MNTTLIDSAIAAAVTTAQSLPSPINVAPSPVEGWPAGTTATVATQKFRTIHGSGFRVIGEIVFPNGYKARRIVNHVEGGPADMPWPSDIEAAAKQWLSESIIAGESWLSKWFWGSRLTDMAVMYLQALTAVAGDQEALATAKPVLSALHTWVYSVRSAAANGQRMFSNPPHTYEEFVTENH